jgi:hypothetical protein
MTHSEHLGQADRFIAECKKRIQRQREVIATAYETHLARDNFACRTEVACSHVSRLFSGCGSRRTSHPFSSSRSNAKQEHSPVLATVAQSVEHRQPVAVTRHRLPRRSGTSAPAAFRPLPQLAGSVPTSQVRCA